MTSASLTTNNACSASLIEVDVWLEVGREGKVFSYKDGLSLDVALGDIVLVQLMVQHKVNIKCFTNHTFEI